MLDQDRLAAKTIVNIYMDLGYSAIAVGPHDLADGFEQLAAAAVSGFPWISANLTDDHGKLLFPPWVLAEANGQTIGILGLTGTASGPGYRTRSWQEAVPQYLDQLFPACDFLMVLSNLTMEENIALAEMFPQIHLLVSAEKNGGNIPPTRHTNTMFVQSHSKGKYLGIVEIEWRDGVLWQETIDSALAIAPILRQQLQGLGQKKLLRHPGLDRLERFAKLSESDLSAAGGWLGGRYGFRFRSLPPHIQPSPAVEKILAKMKEDIAAVNQQSRQQQADAAARPDMAISAKFVGSAACQPCHSYQYDQWQKSSHARAYETLRNSSQQYNLRCLPCHTTWQIPPGATAEKGFGIATLDLLEIPPQRQNVGCESCHGPGQDHIKDGKAGTFVEIKEKICVFCHSQQMDPDFRFQEKVRKIRCSPSG